MRFQTFRTFVIGVLAASLVLVCVGASRAVADACFEGNPFASVSHVAVGQQAASGIFEPSGGDRFSGTIDWGDGTSTSFTVNESVHHAYKKAGTYPETFDAAGTVQLCLIGGGGCHDDACTNTGTLVQTFVVGARGSGSPTTTAQPDATAADGAPAARTEGPDSASARLKAAIAGADFTPLLPTVAELTKLGDFGELPLAQNDPPDKVTQFTSLCNGPTTALVNGVENLRVFGNDTKAGYVHTIIGAAPDAASAKNFIAGTRAAIKSCTTYLAPDGNGTWQPRAAKAARVKLPQHVGDGIATVHLSLTKPDALALDDLFAYTRKGQLLGLVVLSATPDAADPHVFSTLTQRTAQRMSAEWAKLQKQAKN